MTNASLWASGAVSALLALSVPAAHAQDTVADVNFDAPDRVTDLVDEIGEDVQDDFDRDLDPFGNSGRELGFQGSVSLRATLTSGNSNTTDVGLGTRLGFFDGLNGSDFNFAYTYSDDGNSGDDVEENLYLSYGYTREFGRDLYGFAQGVAIYDNTDADPDDADSDDAVYRSDIFVGAGLGYRIAESEQLQWSLQAGPGYRWYEPFNEDRVEEVAVSLSSNLLYQVSPTVAITNDTDVIASDNNRLVTNDLALSVALNQSLSLRTSLLTEFNSDPGVNMDLSERERVDNTLGLAVVYSF